jgi:hypothetical protein
MARKIADCRRFESDSKCSLTIIGEEDEVVAVTRTALNCASSCGRCWSPRTVISPARGSQNRSLPRTCAFAPRHSLIPKRRVGCLG